MIIFAVIAWSDYLDGIAARVTGQYSRLGALLDPLVDRLLIISGVAVCWYFELLPRWALAVLVARELFMIGLVRWGLRRRLDAKVNWLGRAGRVAGHGRAVLRHGRAGRRWARSASTSASCWCSGRTAQYVREARPHEPRPSKAQAQLDIAKVPNITTGEDTTTMDTFPDLGSLSDQELKDLIQQLTDEEQEVSYRRRILHGKIDILRAELVNRLRKKHEGGEEVISGADVQRLTDILAGRASGDGDEL